MPPRNKILRSHSTLPRNRHVCPTATRHAYKRNSQRAATPPLARSAFWSLFSCVRFRGVPVWHRAGCRPLPRTGGGDNRQENQRELLPSIGYDARQRGTVVNPFGSAPTFCGQNYLDSVWGHCCYYYEGPQRSEPTMDSKTMNLVFPYVYKNRIWFSLLSMFPRNSKTRGRLLRTFVWRRNLLLYTMFGRRYRARNRPKVRHTCELCSARLMPV